MIDADKIKKFFVWIFTLVGLILIIIGAVGFLNIGLKKYVFTKADDSYCAYIEPVTVPAGKTTKTSEADTAAQLKRCQEQQVSQRQRDMAQDLAFLIVGTPIFFGFLRKTRE